MSDGTRGPAYAAVPCGRTAPLVRAASTRGEAAGALSEAGRAGSGADGGRGGCSGRRGHSAGDRDGGRASPHAGPDPQTAQRQGRTVAAPAGFR